MLVNPSNDVIVDDSIFASRFVLEALDELKKTTEDMEDRLRALEQVNWFYYLKCIELQIQK